MPGRTLTQTLPPIPEPSEYLVLLLLAMGPWLSTWNESVDETQRIAKHQYTPDGPHPSHRTVVALGKGTEASTCSRATGSSQTLRSVMEGTITVCVEAAVPYLIYFLTFSQLTSKTRH